MADGGELSVTFWGVRGSYPVPGPETVRYGGNTTCLEVRAGGHLIVIDCGLGAIRLGKRIMADDVRRFSLFFTHTHLDHVNGLPFFRPFYDPSFDVRCWAGHLTPPDTLETVFSSLMARPLFPAKLTVLRECQLSHFKPGDRLKPQPGLEVGTVRLNHPGGATGYRFHWAGKTMAIITDHEHGDAAIDAAIVDFVSDADIMVYDATFTDAEYPAYQGWGHSTWQQMLRVADAAGVKTPVAFHHSPMRSDDALDAIAEEISAQHKSAVIAKEGMTLAV
ncbi:MAG: MBL fold metallo-hydrolase [Hyphomicrobiales bacterium]|nr:MBL fold metallo-hydrolase [Hyphomicrobiales bacterium]